MAEDEHTVVSQGETAFDCLGLHAEMAHVFSTFSPAIALSAFRSDCLFIASLETADPDPMKHSPRRHPNEASK